MASHYETLGIEPDATAEEIKKAYRKKISKAHTDTNAGASHVDAATINVAYEVLSDPERRKLYDATGADDIRAIRAQSHLILQQKSMEFVQSQPEGSDMIPYIRNCLQNDMQMVMQNKSRGEMLLARLERERAKIKYKGAEPTNPIHQVFDGQITFVKDQLKKVDIDLQKIRMAQELLAFYASDVTASAYVVRHYHLGFGGVNVINPFA